MRVRIAPKGSYFLGIDPGSSGALCILNKEGQPVNLAKLPTVKTRRGRTKLDTPSLKTFLQRFELHHACVEDIWAQPSQGVKAAFTYGYNYGQLCDALEASGVPVEFITPATWQKAYKVPKGKQSSIHISLQFYPSLRDVLKHKNSHNKADALLIARYCWEKYHHV